MFLIGLIVSIQPEHTANTTAISNTKVVSHDHHVHICQKWNYVLMCTHRSHVLLCFHVLSPLLCGPCWWSQKQAGWTWTCSESHCVLSCQWPECTCGSNRIKSKLRQAELSTLQCLLAKRIRAMIPLDDSFSYPFVMIHGQISEDVALCLDNRKHAIWGKHLQR